MARMLKLFTRRKSDTWEARQKQRAAFHDALVHRCAESQMR